MKKIQNVVANTLRNKLLAARKEINPDFKFSDDLHLSPWEFNMLLFYVEGELKVNIGEDEASIHSTVNDLIQCLYLKKNVHSDEMAH